MSWHRFLRDPVALARVPRASIRTLASCSGRTARLPFFLGVLVVWVALLLLAQLLQPPASAQRPGSPTLPILLLGVLCWSLTVLMLKRLSDMGRSRLHIIWILAASLLASIAGPPSLPAGLLLTLINIGVFAWLLFAPSAPCPVADGRSRPAQRERRTV
jgi:uncharacterized membrane protein YhaH (DUF805 family)